MRTINCCWHNSVQFSSSRHFSWRDFSLVQQYYWSNSHLASGNNSNSIININKIPRRDVSTFEALRFVTQMFTLYLYTIWVSVCLLHFVFVCSDLFLKTLYSVCIHNSCFVSIAQSLARELLLWNNLWWKQFESYSELEKVPTNVFQSFSMHGSFPFFQIIFLFSSSFSLSEILINI